MDRDEQRREKEQMEQALELLQIKIEKQIEQVRTEQEKLIRERERQQEETKKIEKQIE